MQSKQSVNTTGIIWLSIILGMLGVVFTVTITIFLAVYDLEEVDDAYVVTRDRQAPVEQGEPPVLEGSEDIEWNDRHIKWWPYEEGLREARQKGLPVLYVQYATWCPDCKATSHHFYDPGIVELSRHFVMIRTDVDASGGEVSQYELDGLYVPKVLFLRPDGSVRQELYPDSGMKRSDGKFYYGQGYREQLGLQMERALDS